MPEAAGNFDDGDARFWLLIPDGLHLFVLSSNPSADSYSGFMPRRLLSEMRRRRDRQCRHCQNLILNFDSPACAKGLPTRRYRFFQGLEPGMNIALGEIEALVKEVGTMRMKFATRNPVEAGGRSILIPEGCRIELCLQGCIYKY